MIALIGAGVPLALAAGTASSLPITAVLFGVSGLFTGPFAGALFTARNDHAPGPLRAQVFTIGAGLKTTAAAAGAALACTLAHAPTATQLLLAASCPLLAGTAGAILLTVSHRRRGLAQRAST